MPQSLEFGPFKGTVGSCEGVDFIPSKIGLLLWLYGVFKGTGSELRLKKSAISGQKTAKPKFSKIRQKSNFAPILLGRISKFSEEQDLSEKQGQISVATIFKFARFNLNLV